MYDLNHSRLAPLPGPSRQRQTSPHPYIYTQHLALQVTQGSSDSSTMVAPSSKSVTTATEDDAQTQQPKDDNPKRRTWKSRLKGRRKSQPDEQQAAPTTPTATSTATTTTTTTTTTRKSAKFTKNVKGRLGRLLPKNSQKNNLKTEGSDETDPELVVGSDDKQGSSSPSNPQSPLSTAKTDIVGNTHGHVSITVVAGVVCMYVCMYV